MTNPADLFLQDIRIQARKLKELADKALVQVRDEDLAVTLDPESNSLAIIVQHLAGNLRSRWTDFLTSDGEKPDRNRDSERGWEKNASVGLCHRFSASFRPPLPVTTGSTFR